MITTLGQHKIEIPEEQCNELMDHLDDLNRVALPESYMFASLLEKGLTGKESFAMLVHWKNTRQLT